MIDFDFLIDGEFLRVALGHHLEEKSTSTESVVEIEYLEKHPAPKPAGSILHDDWVSCVQGANNRWVWKQTLAYRASLTCKCQPF